MNRLLENGQLQEMSCGSNFAYILSDNSLFLPTEYKVLQSQSGGGFVRCMKMLYNGHVQLFYMVNSLKPLSNMISSMDADSFMVVVSNLFADIIEIKSNGFLSCQNVELSFDKIFVDPTTLKVSLIYLPVAAHLFDDYSSYESQLRANLVKLINGIPEFSTPKIMRLVSDLSNGMLSLDDLHARIKGGAVTAGMSSGIVKDKVSNDGNAAGCSLKIVAMNAPTRFELEVTKDSFVIGKNAASVDGVITFNKVISRVHCRIDRKGQQYTVTDMQSANGTFVNRMRLQPNQTHPLQNGDILRLANSDFQVVITKGGAV